MGLEDGGAPKPDKVDGGTVAAVLDWGGLYARYWDWLPELLC